MSGGWASGADARKIHGPFPGKGAAPQQVLVSDMPAGKPDIPPRKRIRGVPSVTDDPGEDYQPGHGTWRGV
jgi:hypothetical protein